MPNPKNHGPMEVRSENAVLVDKPLDIHSSACEQVPYLSTPVNLYNNSPRLLHHLYSSFNSKQVVETVDKYRLIHKKQPRLLSLLYLYTYLYIKQ